MIGGGAHMAKVTTPSGTGNLSNMIIITPDGKARKYAKPKDPRSDAQLSYRQLMRGLYDVLPHFSDPVDTGLRTQATPGWRWSSYTFQHWAASHGTAIHTDLPYYGASYR